MLLIVGALILSGSYSSAQTTHYNVYAKSNNRNHYKKFLPKTQFVRPYVKRNGKAVAPYFRRKPVR